MNEKEEKEEFERWRQEYEKRGGELEKEFEEKQEKFEDRAEGLNDRARLLAKQSSEGVAEFLYDFTKFYEEYSVHQKEMIYVAEITLRNFIMGIKTQRDAFKSIVKSGDKQANEFSKELNDIADERKKEEKLAELQKRLLFVSRWEKAVESCEKEIDRSKEFLKEISKQKLFFQEEFIEVLGEKDRLLKKKDVPVIKRIWKEFFLEFEEFNQLVLKDVKRKISKFRRMMNILSCAKDDDEIYIETLKELQEMNEVTEQTAKTQRRTEKIQNVMLGELGQLKRNTSTRQQVLISICSAVIGFLLAKFFSN